MWIKAVNRDKWEPGDHSWICSDHFLHGWHGEEPSDDNYGPTLFQYKITRSEEDLRREKRRLDRESTKEKHDEEVILKKRETASLQF